MSSDVTQPGTITELAQLLRDTATTHPVVTVRGGGSKAGWGALGAEPDLVIDMTGMAGVVEHARGDLVATLEAGARLTDVQHGFAAAGQWLPLDPPEHGATIGGIVAAGASGPHRLRYGTPRDLVIGVTVVLSDGTVAKSGGKVVKNVAGYDLGRLFAGSFGTLGVIARCTVKLQPLPAARRVVSVAATEPGAVATALARTTVSPAAAEWDGAHVYVVVEGSPDAADAMAAELVEALSGRLVGDHLPAAFGARPWAPGEVAVKVTHRLSALDQVVMAVRRHLGAARLSAHVGSGVVWAGWPTPADPTDAGSAIDALRAAVAAYDGSVVVVDAPLGVKQAVDVWGPVRGAPVMHRMKERFDPDRRLNPGRFVDGI